MNQFYTYFHTRNDTGAVFYVGKGRDGRARTPKRNVYWNRIAAKHGHTVHFAMTNLEEKDALEHEKFLILCFRDIGCKLANMTAGGEGITGYKFAPEQIKANSERVKRQMADPAMIERISAGAKARCNTPEYKEARKGITKRAWSKPELREKYVAAAKARWADPEERRKQSERTKAHIELNGPPKFSKETLAKIAKAKTGKKHSEETKAKMRAAKAKSRAAKAINP